MITTIVVLAAVGFFISLYTFITEQKVKTNPEYKAACDLSDTISCTKPMKSEYANLLFVSNAIVGMGFYVVVGILAALNSVKLLFYAAVVGCVSSVFLAYLLYFKIKSLCILCTLLYVINFIILLLVWKLYH